MRVAAPTALAPTAKPRRSSTYERSKDERDHSACGFRRADNQPDILAVLAKLEIEEGAAFLLPTHHLMHALPRLDRVNKLELETAALVVPERVGIERRELADPGLQI